LPDRGTPLKVTGPTYVPPNPTHIAWAVACMMFGELGYLVAETSGLTDHRPKKERLTMSNKSVFGIYGSRAEASNAVDAMRAAGFRNADISALLPENAGTKDFAVEKNTKAPEGAATGVASGAVLGGAFGWLVGIGTIAIPGIGPFLAAGPIMTALAGVGAGAVTGGLIGTLAGLGMPEYEAKRYEGRIKSGGILLSIHCDNSDWVKRAKELMEQTGATDISSAGESPADFMKTDVPMPRSASYR
jgi:hypothetical protein